MEPNTATLDALQSPPIEGTDNNVMLSTIGEIHEAIINLLKVAGYTEEELNKNRLGKVVFTYMMRNRMMLGAKISTVSKAVNHVLNTLQ